MSPPETKPIPLPTDWFQSAADYLEAHGLVAKTPHIRSSDFGGTRNCPFQWYLRRRLGLVPMIKRSAALNRGSWFHSRAAIDSDDPYIIEATLDAIEDDRLSELEVYFDACGILPAARSSIITEEKRDRAMACIWWEAANHLPLPSEDPATRGKTLDDLLNRPGWITLSRELKVSLPSTYHEGLRDTIQIDRLIYDDNAKGLWIVDYKTCDESPLVRMATCPVEFQTRHYVHVTSQALICGLLDTLFTTHGVPRPTSVMGMIHPVVRKPTIIFGQNDRDCTITHRPLKSGPRKGQMIEERTYQGEPKLSNYLDRCLRWYRATGEYEDKAGEWATDPPVNLSTTFASSLLDETQLSLYLAQLDSVAQYVLRDPHPGLFEQSGSHMRLYGNLSKYAPFYTVPPGHWPEVIAREGFVVDHRD